MIQRDSVHYSYNTPSHCCQNPALGFQQNAKFDFSLLYKIRIFFGRCVHLFRLLIINAFSGFELISFDVDRDWSEDANVHICEF